MTGDQVYSLATQRVPEPAGTPLAPAAAPPSMAQSQAVQQVHGQMFSIAGPDGDMREGLHGLYYADSRVASIFRLRVGGRTPDVMSVQQLGPARTFVLGRAAPPPDAHDSVVLVERERSLDGALEEVVRLRNFGRGSVQLELEIEVGTDFADLFAVKEGRSSAQIGPPAPALPPGEHRNVNGLPVVCQFRPMRSPTAGRASAPHLLVAADGTPTLDEDVLQWTVEVGGNSAAVVRVRLQPSSGPTPPESWLTHPDLLSRAPAPPEPAPARIDSESPELAAVVARSLADLNGLRLRLPGTRMPILAAGAPWFMTLFGRDSLLAGYMALPWDPSLLAGALEILAATAGRERNAVTEEAPGRILHELRVGEDSARAIGGHRYYGSVDAAPLFVMMLAEAWRWGADARWVHGLLPTADAALAWAERQASTHPAGSLAYRRMTPGGLFNQGWKDSFDGITDAAGAIPPPPIALCEVQAYHYRALLDRAELAEAFGEGTLAHRARSRAGVLRDRFHAAFCSTGQEFPALALDGAGQASDALASNAAHCLWAGLLDDAPAEALIRRLAGSDMCSGWGLRTLSTHMVAYNPMSYHNGSVWPHDTALAVAGLARYDHVPGARDLAWQLARGLIAAATAFEGRLPELMCGFDARDYPQPVPYPSSCSPQAWAAAAPLLLLRALLRLQPDVPRDRISLDPVLPPEWGTVRISGMRLGAATVDLAATGSTGHVR